MVSIPLPQTLSYEEFLALEERTADERYELVDGKAWLMTGGTPRHSRIMSNTVVAFAASLGDGPCQVYVSDLRVKLGEDSAAYPDVAIACEPLQHPEGDRHAVTNPVVIVEVLSKSTERWDRVGKFQRYQRLTSLRHYLLIDQLEPVVEHFERVEDVWTYRIFNSGGRIQLAGLDIELEVDALYRNLPSA